MPDAFSRMEMLLGDAGADKLGRARIAVFGLGGAGSFAAEALARCGVASLTLVDNGIVSVTDINRQLYALRSTVGKNNVQIAKMRIRDIDEGILVNTYETFYNNETAGMFDLKNYDYIIDAMNTVESKLLLIENAKISKTPIISCMSTDDRMDPSKLEIMDISRSVLCPIAKQIRTKLRKKGIRKVKVLSSREKISDIQMHGSISFVPGAAGMMLAGVVVKDLLGKSDRKHRYKK
ncbi:MULTISPECIES: tRNA threonylcarbamoyladenosine dehydratase [unclassified Blautia]|uniref:tRNA threonylcarbamoyladenosine dehydratase n=1 Tax=unclassified Blautia TaxID=2648079 RepID=UPI003F8B5B73